MFRSRPQKTITQVSAPNGSVGDHNGAIFAIGKPRSGAVGVLNSGSVFVYERNALGSYSETTILTAEAPADSDAFGGSVAIADETIIVGTRDEFSGSGRVHVFSRDATGEFSQSRSLAAAGDLIVVGAPSAAGVVPGTGAAYVYRRDAAGEYSLVDTPLVPDGEFRDAFGHAVAIAGHQIVVGAPSHSRQSGSACVYTPLDSGGYGQERNHFTTLNQR